MSPTIRGVQEDTVWAQSSSATFARWEQQTWFWVDSLHIAVLPLCSEVNQLDKNNSLAGGPEHSIDKIHFICKVGAADVVLGGFTAYCCIATVLCASGFTI